MGKYENYCIFLEPFFEVLTTRENFEKDKVITFKCKESNHINVLSIASFGNKKCKIQIEDFCTECKENRENDENIEQFKLKIKEKNGHNVKTVDFSSRIVVYDCGNCGSENKTFTQNLNKTTASSYCSKCQYDKNRLDFSVIEKIVEESSMILLTKEDEYTNNKQKLKMLCKCGEPYEAVLSDIKRGKNCKSCKTEKFKETCLEIYGEDNVSKVPFIFEKILISNFRRKVFEFPETKRKVIVMGYEPMAITTLITRESDPYLLKKIHEDDIILGKEIKRFRYKDNEGTDHVYFPDIYINNTNHIIEVKSDYTFYRDREKNILKFRAVVENGYILRLMIYNDKKELKYESMCITTENIEKMCKEIDTILF